MVAAGEPSWALDLHIPDEFFLVCDNKSRVSWRISCLCRENIFSTLQKPPGLCQITRHFQLKYTHESVLRPAALWDDSIDFLSLIKLSDLHSIAYGVYLLLLAYEHSAGSSPVPWQSSGCSSAWSTNAPHPFHPVFPKETVFIVWNAVGISSVPPCL